MKRKAKPAFVGKTALYKINVLLNLAEKDPTHSKRYVHLALEISKKYNTPIPKDLKKRICKKCNAFLTPGKNLKVRIVGKPNYAVTYKCMECGNSAKSVFSGEKSEKNAKRHKRAAKNSPKPKASGKNRQKRLK